MLGILLAAGFSRRFGAADKLLQPLADGRPLAVAAAQNLLTAIPDSCAIVRPENTRLTELLQAAGLRVFHCAEPVQTMAESLSTAVRLGTAAVGRDTDLVIALADMPFIQPATIAAVAARLEAGAAIVVPVYQGRRGHPVGFAACYQQELLALQGDEGARSVVRRHQHEVLTLACDDPGILVDIDTRGDLP